MFFFFALPAVVCVLSFIGFVYEKQTYFDDNFSILRKFFWKKIKRKGMELKTTNPYIFKQVNKKVNEFINRKSYEYDEEGFEKIEIEEKPLSNKKGLDLNRDEVAKLYEQILEFNSFISFYELIEQCCDHNDKKFDFYLGKYIYKLSIKYGDDDMKPFLKKIRNYKCTKIEELKYFQFQLGKEFCQYILLDDDDKLSKDNELFEKDENENKRIECLDIINRKFEKIYKKIQKYFEDSLRGIKENETIIEDLSEQISRPIIKLSEKIKDIYQKSQDKKSSEMNDLLEHEFDKRVTRKRTSFDNTYILGDVTDEISVIHDSIEITRVDQISLGIGSRNRSRSRSRSRSGSMRRSMSISRSISNGRSRSRSRSMSGSGRAPSRSRSRSRSSSRSRSRSRSMKSRSRSRSRSCSRSRSRSKSMRSNSRVRSQSRSRSRSRCRSRSRSRSRKSMEFLSGIFGRRRRKPKKRKIKTPSRSRSKSRSLFKRSRSISLTRSRSRNKDQITNNEESKARLKTLRDLLAKKRKEIQQIRKKIDKSKGDINNFEIISSLELRLIQLCEEVSEIIEEIESILLQQ